MLDERFILVGCTVHGVVLVVDRQNILAMESYLDKRLVSLWKPKFVNLLVLPHEVGSLYPERELLRRVTFDSDNGIVLNVNPYLALEQILVSTFGNRFCDETAVRSDLLLTKQVEDVVCEGDRAIVVLLTGRCCDLASNQRI